jgi:hypothetical protein
MKAKLQRLIGTAVLGLALCSHSLPAWAGSVDLSKVEVGTNFGKGTMAGARYSGDSQQYIGCSFSETYDLTVNCLARDKTGKSFVCWSNDVRFVDAVKAMTDYSHISFSSAPGTTSCRDIIVTNSSSHLR